MRTWLKRTGVLLLVALLALLISGAGRLSLDRLLVRSA